MNGPGAYTVFTNKSSSHRPQDRWLDELQSYNFEVQHAAGAKHVVPDALGRRADYIPSYKKMNLISADIVTQIVEAYSEYDWTRTIINNFNNGDDDQGLQNGKVAVHAKNYAFYGKILHWTDSAHSILYVPSSRQLRQNSILLFHEDNDDHFGIDKTFAKMTRYLYWVRMREDVTRFVRACNNCQVNKGSNKQPTGLLQPHDVPSRCWDVISADFLTELPTSEQGNDSVLVVVDNFSKRAVFIPTTKDVDAPRVEQLFMDYVFSKHRVPISIISDRDPKFTAKHWGCMIEFLNVRLNMASKHHPQTDGQSENLINTLSNMLRGVI